jgi:hypothetical protein
MTRLLPIQYLSPDPRDPVGLRGAQWSKLSKKERTRYVDRAFRFWRTEGFPHYRLSTKQVRLEFLRVLNLDWRRLFSRGDIRSSNAGLRLANAYQPRMWSARVSRYLSPMDVFHDDELFRKAITRSLTIWPRRFGANASSLRRILKTFTSTASVSNYRPAVAKAIISKYSRNSSVVVDFSAGYGGRLLGALALDRQYVGIEVNKSQILGYRRMRRDIIAAGFALPSSRFLRGRAEKTLTKIPGSAADLVYSSPPFFNWERYSNSSEHSYKRYDTFEQWRSEFLVPVITQSIRILSKKGHLVLNVTDGKRLPTSHDVQFVARSLGFTLVDSHRMIFPKVPYLHPRNGNPTKKEVLLVFQK